MLILLIGLNCLLNSAEEAARYIEMYKVYENKPPDALQGQTSADYLSKVSGNIFLQMQVCGSTFSSLIQVHSITSKNTKQVLIMVFLSKIIFPK